MCADGRLKNHFLFTRDSYKDFLLRHGSFSFVIVSQKMYTQANSEWQRESSVQRWVLGTKEECA